MNQTGFLMCSSIVCVRQKILHTQTYTDDIKIYKNSHYPLLCDSTKIEKEKREHAKQHGMIRTEITGAEIAEEMEKERRLFQLQMCEVGCEMKLR